MSLSCGECNREFTVKSNLTRHLRMVHNIEVERIDILPADFDVYHYKCLEGCNISFKYNRELRKHLRNKHNINLVELNLEFPNTEGKGVSVTCRGRQKHVSEFNKWLHNEETSNYVQYVHLTATKRRSTGAETYYYECSRTGKRTYVDENIRKRKPKKWLAKLNRGCTSQIIVNKSYDGSYSIIYFKTHYGHEIGLEHVKLSKQDRGAVASKLLLGLPISTVLHSVKNPTSTLKRINLLAQKDVFNIRKSFNIDLRDGKIASLDAININSFLSACSSHPHNPILYSNIKDFAESGYICLIIMSKYQSEVLKEGGRNIVMVSSIPLNNCDFDLITLFVINKHWESFPAACMFTNKTDYATYELFFGKLQQKVGNVVPAIFISNCSEMYYQAWSTVMGDVDYHLYNPAQVDLDWKLNLNKILCSETDVTRVKRKWVYDTLKTLQGNCDESDFLENFEATLKVLTLDADFTDFLQYFVEHYTDPKNWAMCYRAGYNLPSKQLDAISDVLRQYLENETRFDKIFHALIRFIRDETVNWMLKAKASRAHFLSENDSRHHTLGDKHFDSTHLSESLWNVTDQDLEETYVVERCLEKNCCNLICSSCHICLHSFSCTCVDFFLSNTICVHVHYVWVTFFQSIIQNESDVESEEQKYDEEIIIEVDEDQDAGKIDSLEFLKSQILSRTEVLAQNINSVQSETRLKVVLETVNQLCDFVCNGEDVSREDIKKNFLGDHSYL